jgi:hypothetical protein
MTSPNGGQSPDPAPDEQRVTIPEHAAPLREAARNGHRDEYVRAGRPLTRARILRWQREEFREGA